MAHGSRCIVDTLGGDINIIAFLVTLDNETRIYETLK